jgi:L-iditol 2-dehydrogenase
MKALVLTAYNHLEHRDVPEPQVGPEDVLVRVGTCICGSDVHGLDGSIGRRIPPLIMGHGASGVIAELGSGVTTWQDGGRVTFDSTIYCGECYFCQRGQVSLCENRRVLSVSCGDYHQDGASAEYVAVPQHILYRLPDAFSFVQAAMTEALSIAFRAVGRTPVCLNNTAVVIGADEGLRSDTDDVLVNVLVRTGNRGTDLSFEVVRIAPMLKLAIQCLRKGGSLTLIGNLSPTTEFLLQSVVTRELTPYGSCASSGEYPACLDMIARGRSMLTPWSAPSRHCLKEPRGFNACTIGSPA